MDSYRLTCLHGQVLDEVRKYLEVQRQQGQSCQSLKVQLHMYERQLQSDSVVLSLFLFLSFMCMCMYMCVCLLVVCMYVCCIAVSSLARVDVCCLVTRGCMLPCDTWMYAAL